MAQTEPVVLHGPLHPGIKLTVADVAGVLGVGGRWYRVQTTVDAWNRPRTTHRRQPGLVQTCSGCGQMFWFRDPRGRWCEKCCAQRRVDRVLPPAVRTIQCVQCGAPHTARRLTRAYCSPACRQAAYRQRRTLDSTR
jgi:hypothetical protein